MHLVFAHWTKTTNLGDLVAGPYQYFAFKDATHEVVHVRDLNHTHARRADMVIIGGGAVASAARQVWGVAKRPRIVAWGVGQTKHGAIARHVSPAARLYDLYGSREVPLLDGERWVPCPSCMHTSIDEAKTNAPSRYAGVYVNSDPNIIGRYPLPESIARLPKRTNRTGLGEALRFIASCEVLLTNSYHGAYWAQLIGRPVILVGAYSAKFHAYKHQPPVWDGRGNWEDLIPSAVPPTNFLTEARWANIEFHTEVVNLMGDIL